MKKLYTALTASMVLTLGVIVGMYVNQFFLDKSNEEFEKILHPVEDYKLSELSVATPTPLPKENYYDADGNYCAKIDDEFGLCTNENGWKNIGEAINRFSK